MANIYFIGGPLGGTQQSFLEEVSDDYYFWKITRNDVFLFVHGPSGETLRVTQQGFLEDLPFMVKKVAQELIDKGVHPETLNIDINPEVLPGAYGEVALVYTVRGTALEVS